MRGSGYSAVPGLLRLKPRYGLFCLCLMVLAAANPLGAQSFRILGQDKQSYRIEFRLTGLAFQPQAGSQEDAGQFVPRFAGDHLYPEAKEPILGQASFALILPHDVVPVITISAQESEVLDDISVPVFSDTVEGTGVHREAYAGPRVIYGGAQQFSGLPIHTFRLTPFDYDKTDRSLRVFTRVVVEVSIPYPLPVSYAWHWPGNGSFLNTLALNANQVARARPQLRPALTKIASPAWPGPDQAAIKLSVARDDLYQVSAAEIAALGVDTDGISPANLSLFYRGQPYPIQVEGENDGVFDPADRIIFYGRRNRGQGEYYNPYSDTTVYWLTWTGNPGLRIPGRAVVPISGASATAYRQSDHFESDDFYYNGDNSLAIYNTDRVDGEGWIWQRIFAGEEKHFPFVLAGHAGGIRDSILIKLRGITDDAVDPDHHIEVFINNQSIAHHYFDGATESRFSVAVPGGILLDGANELTLASRGDTGAQFDAVYLDWFRVSYERNYEPSGNRLHFSAPPDTSGLVNYSIDFSVQDSLILYDLDPITRLEGYDEIQGSGGVTLAFADSATADAEYLAQAHVAIKPVPDITLDQPSSLRDGANQADYLIVAHRRFWSEAQDLAAYRTQSQGLTTRVVDIQDILDEFNFGMLDPLAIRAFVKYAVENWQAPAPRYVLLFGDATWDYKKNGASSVKDNFVPAFGNPVSDNRLVSINGAGDILPDLFVGRLPVASIAQAQDFVEKIKRYDQIPTDLWLKNIVFLNGGIRQSEQDIFRAQSDTLIKKYVESSPFAGQAVRLYKQTTAQIPGEMREEILQAIDDGALWLTFSGHAGSSTWDLMVDNNDLNQLQNLDKLLFVTSMTCHTARYANPVLDSFGEVFVSGQDLGAAAFWGTAGWGYISQDAVLLDRLFQLVLSDSVQTLGEATTLAKLHLWSTLGFSQINVSTIDQYTLLGDPAMRLKVPNRPDPLITDADVTLTPAQPSQSDSVLQVSLVIHNQGLFVDSLEVSLALISDLDPLARVESRYTLRNLGFRHEESLAFKTGGLAGGVTLAVALDPDDRLVELNNDNNQAAVDFYVFSSNSALLSPLDYSVISETQPRLRVYTPEATDPGRLYLFELDTTATFDSPFLRASPPLGERPILTQWSVAGPVLPDGTYFWRSRVQEGENLTPWLMRRFMIRQGAQVFLWHQDASTGFGASLFSGLAQDGGGIRLVQDPNGGFLASGFVLSEAIGPGISWDEVSLQLAVSGPAQSHLLRVQAFEPATQQWLQVAETPETGVSLASLDAARYALIRLELELATSDSSTSPLLSAWQVAYQPASDLAIHPDKIFVRPDTLLHGQDARVEVMVYNVGLAAAVDPVIGLEVRNDPVGWDSLAQTQLALIEPADSGLVSFALPTGDYPDSRFLRVRVDPGDRVRELSETNNRYLKPFFVARDTVEPEIHIQFDDTEIMAGDQVAEEPTIEVLIRDNSPLAIADTQWVRIMLDDRDFSYGRHQAILDFLPGEAVPNRGAETRVVFRPQLDTGNHVLSITAQDASGNTNALQIDFTVDTRLSLRRVMNVPNPFARQTHFTYILTQPADRVDLSLYTVAGRKILTLKNLPGATGFNAYEWNGLDQDGDRMANGVYLYRLRAFAGDAEAAVIEKLIIMR